MKRSMLLGEIFFLVNFEIGLKILVWIIKATEEEWTTKQLSKANQSQGKVAKGRMNL